VNQLLAAEPRRRCVAEVAQPLKISSLDMDLLHTTATASPQKNRATRLTRVLVLFLMPGSVSAEATMIYYVALPFVRLENGGLVPGEAVECPHSSAVLRRADAMYRNEANAGAVALRAYR
jgi:hypothetical protein